MREFVLKRLVAFVGAVLGAALLLFLVLGFAGNAAGSLPERFLAIVVGSPDLWSRLAVTLPLVILAFAAAGLLATGLRALPGTAKGVAAAVAILPPFWLGLLLVVILAGALELLPANGFLPWSNPAGALSSLVLPAVALGIPFGGLLALRLNHRNRPAALGRTFAELLLATTLVEGVFYLPGLGGLVLGAAEQRDPALLASGLFALALIASIGVLGFSLLGLLRRGERAA